MHCRENFYNAAKRSANENKSGCCSAILLPNICKSLNNVIFIALIFWILETDSKLGFQYSYLGISKAPTSQHLWTYYSPTKRDLFQCFQHLHPLPSPFCQIEFNTINRLSILNISQMHFLSVFTAMPQSTQHCRLPTAISPTTLPIPDVAPLNKCLLLTEATMVYATELSLQSFLYL